MVYVKKKQPKHEKDDGPIFDINEWMDVKRNGLLRSGSWNDSQLKYFISKHPKKEGFFFVTVHLRKKLLMMLDRSEDPTLIVMQHKNDERRIMLTRSPNGYRVYQPDKSKEKYLIKFIVKLNRLVFQEKFNHIADPVFHEKGANSGAIIEFRIEE